MDNLPNLLLVDDSEDNLYFLEGIIKKLDVNLILALSGPEAVDKTKGIELTLAIIDAHLPGMNGYEVASQINEGRDADKVPVIFLISSHDEETESFTSYVSGVADCITKPINKQILHCKINVFLGFFKQKQTIKAEAALLKKDIDELASTNAALKKSKEKYQQYLDNSPDGVFVVDQNRRYIEVNEAACEITGYSKDELLSMAIPDLLSDESRHAYPPNFREVVKTGAMKTESLFKHKNGTLRWWTLEAVKIDDTHFLGFTKDITERKLAEEALRETNDYLENLINHANAPIIVWNPQFLITRFNHAFELLTGRSETEVVGQPLEILFPSAFTIASMELIKNTITGEKWKTVEIDIVHRDGSTRNLLWNSATLFSPDGKSPVATIAQGHDITERKQAEEALRENNAKLELAMKAANMAWWEMDIPTGEVIFDKRKAEMLGFLPEKFKHYKDFMALVHPDDGGKAMNAMRGHIEGQLEKYETEYRIMSQTGEYEWFHDIGSVAKRNSNGKPINVIGLVINISLRKIAEEAIRQSESNLAKAQHIAHIGSWELDIISNSLKVSKEFYEIFGINPDTFDGRVESFIKVIHPDDVERFANMMKNHLSGSNHAALEYRVIHKDGSIHHIFGEGSVEFDKAGNPIGIGTVQDITERKLKDEALQKSEEFFKAVVNNSIELTTLTDTDGIVTFVSPQCENIIGFPGDIFIGKKFPDFIHPDDVVRGKQAWEKVYVEGLELREFEYRIIDSQGSMRWVSHSAKVVKVDEKVLGVQNSIRNITERKIIEEALKVSEEKYKTMLNASPDGILLVNLDGIVTEVSEIGLELFGAETRDDLVGKRIFRFVSFEEKKTIKEIIEKTISEGLAQNITLNLTRKNKSVFVGETSTTLIQRPDGTPLSFMIIVRDISQRKKMETKQFHADRMASLGEMASGIAHEINQPLNIISLVMDNIVYEADREEGIGKGYLKKKSDKIFENIRRIRNIIDHIRAFSKNNDDYILTAFGINSSIENAITLISEQFKHRAISIYLQLEENLPAIIGNTYKFEQVILNLLTNAKDALEEKKSKSAEGYEMFIQIRSYKEGQHLIVEVADNGTGINEVDFEHIMIPFYTTKDTGKGTGLGMPISYQIIKEMNGTLEISNNAFLGATIKIILQIPVK